MNITFYYSEIETIKKIIQYIDDRFNSGEHGDSYWIDHCGERTTVDTGYAFEWWEHCMKPELEDADKCNARLVKKCKEMEKRIAELKAQLPKEGKWMTNIRTLSILRFLRSV